MSNSARRGSTGVPGRSVLRKSEEKQETWVFVSSLMIIVIINIPFAIWQCAALIPCTHHTIHIYTKRVTGTQWLKTWMILPIMREYWRNDRYQLCSPPCEWLYWLLTRLFIRQIWKGIIYLDYTLPIKPKQVSDEFIRIVFPHEKIDTINTQKKMLRNDRST